MAKLRKPSPKYAVVACSGGCRATADCQYGCVGCGVCVSVCPFEAIELNALGVAEVDWTRCIGCGKCEQHCPQHLPIRQELKSAQKAMEGLPYKLGKLVLPHIMHY